LRDDGRAGPHRLRARRQCRLPRVYGLRARGRLHGGLPADPRPRAEGAAQRLSVLAQGRARGGRCVVIAHVSARPVRIAAPFWLVLALIGALAWVVAAGEARDMGAGPGTMGMTFPFFLGMWVSMMAAMMLPAIGPQAAGGRIFGGRTAVGRLPGVLGFAAGVLLPWGAS